MTATSTRLRLVPGRWTRLPGTSVEVLLHGKWQVHLHEGAQIIRTEQRPEYGGWDLTPVLERSYVRTVKSSDAQPR